jgi:peptidoglycan/xylan/chitin deacetylase (PgdA/CDA1 family)
MRYERIKTIGRILRGLQSHRLNAAFTPQKYVRVTYTHQVLKEKEQNFEDVVAYLAKTYQAITPSSFFRMMRRQEPLTGQHVLLTFDDGLMSSYRAIKGTLAKFNIKAIVFVPTQILELRSPSEMKRFAWQQLYFKSGEPPDSLREEEYLTMGRQELLDLHKDGHAVFPHTHSHKRLIEINDAKTAVEELVKPKGILQELLQAPMNAFAFPVGTERAVSGFCYPYLKKEYEFCFSALAGKNTPDTDRHLLHRDCVNSDHAVDHVKNTEEGVFDLYYSFKLARLKQAFAS